MNPPRPASAILGTGHFLPTHIRTNEDLSRMVDTSDAWIRERTGIVERRVIAEGECSSDMATRAAKDALEASKTSAEQLDMIITATVTPDMPMPAASVFLQHKLGISHCPAFDISAACAGFIFALSVADQYIRSRMAKRILVVGVEHLSSIVDWSDRNTCVLFGDGAGAVVLGPAPENGECGILSTSIHSNGKLARLLMIPAGGGELPLTPETLNEKKNKVQMRGTDLFKVAVKYLYDASKDALEAAGLEASQVDWICPHQANIRIIDLLVSWLDVPREKVLMNIDRVGNTSSASIPILLDENIRSGRVKKGDTILMCALGAGVSWGSALVRV